MTYNVFGVTLNPTLLLLLYYYTTNAGAVLKSVKHTISNQ